MARVRAVGIVLRGAKVLVMFRRKEGREYYTFPGGGVEDGESVEQAVIRELGEETTVVAEAERLLYHHIIDDGSEQYFYLCRYVSGEPSIHPGSPEAERMKAGNYYDPRWVPLVDLPGMLVYPLEVRDRLVAERA
jgi:8-oxo-dGTP pyrophosphatase MutT (NUDIX family)